MSEELKPTLAINSDVQIRQQQETLVANQLLLQGVNSKLQNVETLLVDIKDLVKTIAGNAVNFPQQNMNDYQDLLQAFRTSDLIVDSEALQFKVKNEIIECQENASVKKSSEAIPTASSTSLAGQSIKHPEQSIIKSEFESTSSSPSALLNHHDNSGSAKNSKEKTGSKFQIKDSSSEWKCPHSNCKKIFLFERYLTKHLSRDHMLINPVSKRVVFHLSTPQAAKLQTQEAETDKTAKLMENKSKNTLNASIKTERFGKATKPAESSASLKRKIKSDYDADLKPYLCNYPGCGKRYKTKVTLSHHAKVHPTDA